MIKYMQNGRKVVDKKDGWEIMRTDVRKRKSTAPTRCRPHKNPLLEAAGQTEKKRSVYDEEERAAQQRYFP